MSVLDQVDFTLLQESSAGDNDTTDNEVNNNSLLPDDPHEASNPDHQGDTTSTDEFNDKSSFSDNSQEEASHVDNPKDSHYTDGVNDKSPNPDNIQEVLIPDYPSSAIKVHQALQTG